MFVSHTQQCNELEIMRGICVCQMTLQAVLSWSCTNTQPSKQCAIIGDDHHSPPLQMERTAMNSTGSQCRQTMFIDAPHPCTNFVLVSPLDSADIAAE